MKKVAVIGDVIEDIIVISNGERKSNTDNPSRIQSTPGGSGANFAVWLASMGVETELFARVSKIDKERLDAHFKSVGVTPRLQADESLETGRIVVLAEGNERTFFTDRGANQKLVITELPSCNFLYISGYSVVTLGAEQTQTLIQAATERGSLVAVDPGSTSFIEAFGVGTFLSAIKGANIIFPNEDEYRLLSQGRNLANYFSECVVTRGAEGAEIIGLSSTSALKVKVVDPTGAGDAFAAKYVKARMEGAQPTDALSRATAFAAKAVTVPGGQPKVN